MPLALRPVHINPQPHAWPSASEDLKALSPDSKRQGHHVCGWGEGREGENPSPPHVLGQEGKGHALKASGGSGQ